MKTDPQLRWQCEDGSALMAAAVAACAAVAAYSLPLKLNIVVAIAAGFYHCLALRDNGTVAAWGWNNSQQTNVPPGLSNVVAVSGGGYFSAALKRDGTVAAWGLGTSGQTNVPANLTNAVAIFAGASHVLALRADGEKRHTLVVKGVLDIPFGFAGPIAADHVRIAGDHRVAGVVEIDGDRLAIG